MSNRAYWYAFAAGWCSCMAGALYIPCHAHGPGVAVFVVGQLCGYFALHEHAPARWWRSLRCQTGHHRVTVWADPSLPIRACCLDCDRTLWWGNKVVRTPSRRYALRGKA